jgi:hypothetical protein
MKRKFTVFVAVISCAAGLLWMLKFSALITKTPLNMSENQTNSLKDFPEIDLIKIAFNEAKKGADIPESSQPKVTYTGDVARIIWYFDQSPKHIYPSGDYHALVEIDRRSGKILKVLGPP